MYQPSPLPPSLLLPPFPSLLSLSPPSSPSTPPSLLRPHFSYYK